jgi:ATP-binding cassette subfamily F protein 3
MKLLGGLLTASEGSFRLGHHVEVAIYTQETERQLDASRSVLEEAAAGSGDHTDGHRRTVLGCLGFRQEAVNKSVGVLSGGEVSRLALAKLLLRRANLLLLDEPTNHLDIPSKDRLQEALQHFGGTFVVVSHDRYFLDGVATRVWEIRDGRLRDYPGTYSAFLEHKEGLFEEASQQAPATPGKAARSRESRKLATEEKIRRGRLLKEPKQRVERVEKLVTAVEQSLARIENELLRQEVSQDLQRLQQLDRQFRELKKDQARLYQEWEEAQQELEQMTAKLERGQL